MIVVRFALSGGERDAGDQERENGRKANGLFHDGFSFFFALVEWRGLSGASALTLARPMAARVSSKRAGSSAGTESSRLSQSFKSSRISSRIAVISSRSA